MMAKGSRSFSTVAHTSVTADHAVGSRPVPTDQVSPNPLNTRVISADSPRVLRLRDSIAKHGQLEAVTVVTRAAFTAIFDEYKQAVEPVTYVEVTGGQRLMACMLLGRPITLSVNDELASDRAAFIAATAEENLGRDDLDALEQAEIVARLVTECGGNQSEAARRLEMSQPWVAHHMAVLKLSVGAQQLIRAYNLPQREVRGGLWKLPEALQIATLEKAAKAREAITAGIGDEDDRAVPQQRKVRVPREVAAVRKLVSTPAEKVAAAWVAEAPLEYRRALAAALVPEED